MPKKNAPKQRNLLQTATYQNTTKAGNRHQGFVSKVLTGERKVTSSHSRNEDGRVTKHGQRDFFKGATDDEAARQRRLTKNPKLRNSGPKPRKGKKK